MPGIVGQLLLTSRQLFQFLFQLILRLCLLLRRSIVSGLVLILGDVHFQFIHLCHIAAVLLLTTLPALTLRLLLHLDFVEHGFCTQDVLQCLLFRLDGIIQFHLVQITGRRRHGSNGLLDIIGKLLAP